MLGRGSAMWLACLCTLAGVHAVSSATPLTVDAALGGTRWAELSAKVQAGEALLGVEAAILHTLDGTTEHFYVPRAEVADFRASLAKMGLRYHRKFPHVDPKQLRVFDVVGGRRYAKRRPQAAASALAGLPQRYDEVAINKGGEVGFDERGMQLIASGLHLHEDTLGVSLTQPGRTQSGSAVRRTRI